MPEDTRLEEPPALGHKKTRQNLEELLLYYQVELTRLEIQYFKRKLTPIFGRIQYRADATVDDTSSASENIP